MNSGYDIEQRCGIVIVNWNGWADTLECLEAILKMEGFNGPVCIIDNGSQDGSLGFFKAWAVGELCIISESCDKRIRELVVPNGSKPLRHEFLRLDQLALDNEIMPGLYFIEVGKNIGFAAANNIGLGFLQQCLSLDLFWLINNDALPDNLAYSAMISHGFDSSAPKIVGNVLIEYYSPDAIQAVGAAFNIWTGTCKHNLEGVDCSELANLPVSVVVDYPIGAGLCINREFLLRNGFLSEDYFLYYEEIDWMHRRGKFMKAACLTKSRLYHKGGASIKGGKKSRDRSLMSDYFMIRGRICFAKKLAAPVFLCVSLITLLVIFRRIKPGSMHYFFNALRAYVHGFVGEMDYV